MKEASPSEALIFLYHIFDVIQQRRCHRDHHTHSQLSSRHFFVPSVYKFLYFHPLALIHLSLWFFLACILHVWMTVERIYFNGSTSCRKNGQQFGTVQDKWFLSRGRSSLTPPIVVHVQRQLNPSLHNTSMPSLLNKIFKIEIIVLNNRRWSLFVC